MKLIAWLLLLLPVCSFAQITGTKPACPITVDTGATYYPDHLWIICDDGGGDTTLEDEGSSGTNYNLTFSAGTGAGPDWITDGTHGDVLDFVPANDDRAQGTITMSGTNTVCAAVNFDATATQQAFVQFGDASANTYFLLEAWTDNDPQSVARLSSGTNDVNNQTGDNDVADGAWHWVCGVFDDDSNDHKLDGLTLDTQAHANTGILAAIDEFTLGGRGDSGSLAADLDGKIGAVAWWESDQTANLTSIWNSGDPWPQIGLSSSSTCVPCARMYQ